MITPATRKLMEYINSQEQAEDPDAMLIKALETEDRIDPKTVYRLELKKRRNQMILKKMLEDAGMHDLGKSFTVSRGKYLSDDEEI